jgi:hypothetical protein
MKKLGKFSCAPFGLVQPDRSNKTKNCGFCLFQAESEVWLHFKALKWFTVVYDRFKVVTAKERTASSFFLQEDEALCRI